MNGFVTKLSIELGISIPWLSFHLSLDFREKLLTDIEKLLDEQLAEGVNSL